MRWVSKSGFDSLTVVCSWRVDHPGGIGDQLDRARNGGTVAKYLGWYVELEGIRVDPPLHGRMDAWTVE